MPCMHGLWIQSFFSCQDPTNPLLEAFVEINAIKEEDPKFMKVPEDLLEDGVPARKPLA